MNIHDEFLMDAYLDGALSSLQKRHFEVHLAGCPACRAAVDQRRALAALLRSVPAAEMRKSEERFVAEVNLQMVRHPARVTRAARSTLPQWGWRLVPVGLLLVMVFVQVSLWIATLFDWLPGARTVLADAAGLAMPLNGAALLPTPFESALGWLGPLSYWNMTGLTGLALLLLAALAYLGWLASWWARSRSN